MSPFRASLRATCLVCLALYKHQAVSLAKCLKNLTWVVLGPEKPALLDLCSVLNDGNWPGATATFGDACLTVAAKSYCSPSDMAGVLDFYGNWVSVGLNMSSSSVYCLLFSL